MDLYVASRNGSGTRLTDDLDRKLAPAWSPDGSSVAFIRGPRAGTEPRPALSLVNVAGVERSLTGPINVVALDWSPDSRWILVATQDDPTGGRLAIVEVATGDLSFVATFADLPLLARWSPDGSQVAVLATSGSSQEQTWLVGSSDTFDLSAIIDRAPNARIGATLGLDWERIRN